MEGKDWYGAFVYQLGRGPLKAERRVRFPYALPKWLRVDGQEESDFFAHEIGF